MGSDLGQSCEALLGASGQSEYRLASLASSWVLREPIHGPTCGLSHGQAQGQAQGLARGLVHGLAFGLKCELVYG